MVSTYEAGKVPDASTAKKKKVKEKKLDMALFVQV